MNRVARRAPAAVVLLALAGWPGTLTGSSRSRIGADAANAIPLVQSLRDLGMPLYMCQTPTGYGDTAETWINTGALLNRMNFALALTGGRMRGIRIPPVRAEETSPALALTSRVLAGDIAPATAATVARARTASQAVSLILGSPDFQKR